MFEEKSDFCAKNVFLVSNLNSNIFELSFTKLLLELLSVVCLTVNKGYSKVINCLTKGIVR